VTSDNFDKIITSQFLTTFQSALVFVEAVGFNFVASIRLHESVLDENVELNEVEGRDILGWLDFEFQVHLHVTFILAGFLGHGIEHGVELVSSLIEHVLIVLLVNLGVQSHREEIIYFHVNLDFLR
jgi:uncharacterized membrane protein YbjE (DUF340 family)